MSTSLVFSIFARRMLALKKLKGLSHFWAGVLLGVATQALLLFVFSRFAADWRTLVLVGASGWVAFFLVRVIFQMLSAEEIRLLNQLRRVSLFPFGKR
jgi:hypothetical protein